MVLMVERCRSKKPTLSGDGTLYYIERRDDLIAPTPLGKNDDGMTSSGDTLRR